MKRFTIPCDFNGKRSPFHVYIGEPTDEDHPLRYQFAWLATIRGGAIPSEVMESFDKLHKIAIEQKVNFEELCVYALGAAESENQLNKKRPVASTSRNLPNSGQKIIQPQNKAIPQQKNPFQLPPLPPNAPLNPEDIKVGEGDVKALVQRASAYMRLNRFAEAINDFSLAIESQQDVTLYQARAKAYLRIGNSENAITDYNTAVALNPHNEMFLNELIGIFISRDAHHDALATIRTLITEHPNNHQFYKKRAEVYEQMQEYQFALEDLQTAITHLPKNSTQLYVYHAVRGQVYRKRGDFTDAIDAYSTALRILTSSKLKFAYQQVIDYHLERAKLYWFSGYPDKSLEDYLFAAREAANRNLYKRLITVCDLGLEHTDSSDLYVMRASAYRNMRQYDKAKEDVWRTIDLAPDNAHIIEELTQLYEILKQYEEAIEICTRVIESEKVTSRHDYLLTRSLFSLRLGHTEHALQDLSFAINLAPRNPDVRIKRAVLLQSIGEINTAINDYTVAITIEPDKYLPYIKRAELHEHIQDYYAALVDYSHALRIDPEQLSILYKRARLRLQLEDYEFALEDLHELADLEPENAEIYLDMATALTALKHTSEAAKSYLKYIEMSKADATVDKTLKVYKTLTILEPSEQFHIHNMFDWLVSTGNDFLVDETLDEYQENANYETIIKAISAHYAEIGNDDRAHFIRLRLDD